MPIPIMPQNVDSLNMNERNFLTPMVDYMKIDISDLSTLVQKKSLTNEVIKISDFEAGLLFRLWKDSQCLSSDAVLDVPSQFSNNDVLRLKASGLISGDTQKVKLTSKGKEVITTMVLSENNSLDKKSTSKTYSERFSETKPKSKTKTSKII